MIKAWLPSCWHSLTTQFYKANCHTTSCPIDKPMWQESEGGLCPTTREKLGPTTFKELNPAKNHVNKPVEDPDELCLASWPTESNNKCACFKPLHVWYFYTAINAGMPQFIVLRFTAPHRYRVLYKLNVCGNPALSKSNCASAHFMSLGHIFVILALFRTSHYICMVICDQRSSVL